MYISVRDRPASDRKVSRSGASTTKPPVGRVVIILGLVSLLTDVSSESVSAILPLYLTLVLGLSPMAYGLIDGLYQGVSALVRLGGGWLADTSDRPKWVAFLGYGLSAVARMFLVFTTGAMGIAAVVTADRVGKGIRTAPRDAMISTSTPSEHLGRAFGTHRMLDTIGAALGPLIAFGLLLLVPGGYSVVLVVSLAFALAGVALLGLLGPDVRTRRTTSERTGPTPPPFRWRDLTDRRLRPLLAVSGVLGLLTVGDGFIFLALHAHVDFDMSWFPLFYVGTNVAYLLLAVPVGRLADRIGRARILVVGHLALVGAYLCSVLPSSAVAAAVGTLFLLGTFYAATDGVIAALAGRLVPVQARTSGIAAAQTVVALARMLASAGFGLLWLLLGPGAAMMTVAALLTGAVLVAATQITRLDSAVVTP